MFFVSPAIFAEKKELATDGSSMGEDYQEFLRKQIASQANSDYEEPSIEELLDLIKAVPPVGTEEEGWNRIFDYQVIPLSLEDYWNCFYADGAPYTPQGQCADVSDDGFSD